MENLKTITIVLLALIMTACGGGEVEEPEFNGGYIVLNSGEQIQAPLPNYYKTVIVKGNVGISQLMNMTKDPSYYFMDTTNVPKIKADDFKGFIVKGNDEYPFKLFGFAKFYSFEVGKDGSLFENKGPASKGDHIYMTHWPTNEVKHKAKKVGQDAFYAAPEIKLEKGIYTAWPGKMFIFEII